jgi:hypothetical protein
MRAIKEQTACFSDGAMYISQFTTVDDVTGEQIGLYISFHSYLLYQNRNMHMQKLTCFVLGCVLS